MSWSFRKDCIGFARSILDPFGGAAKKRDVPARREEQDDESLNYLLCMLIGYFVSTVSHDVDEWLTWGVPYVDICVEALQQDHSLTAKIRDQFIGTVGRGYLFVFEDEESVGVGLEAQEEGDEGWTHVTPLSSFLSTLGAKLEAHERQGQGGVQVVLDGFLGAMQAAVSQGKYDTRTRVLISRRICRMFQLQQQSQHLCAPPSSASQTPTPLLPAKGPCGLSFDGVDIDKDDLQCTTLSSSSTSSSSSAEETPPLLPEQVAFQAALLSNLASHPHLPSPQSPSSLSLSSYFNKDDNSHSGDGTLAVPAFRTTVQPHQMASAVNSFRALKVGVAAASGGALMFCAGGLAAPSIVASLLASLAGMTGAGSTSAMLLDLGVLLNTYGLPVITSAATTMGTSVASWKMMRRTDPLKEFELEPLHAPHTKDLSSNTILVAGPQGYRKDTVDEESSVRTCITDSLSLFRRTLVGDSFTEDQDMKIERKDARNEDRDSARGTRPAEVVYLLLPGHYSGKQDLREVWGGDMDLEVEDEARAGAAAGGGFRFTCREVELSNIGSNCGDSSSTGIIAATSAASSGTSVTANTANIRRGWWRELASGGDFDGDGDDIDGLGGEPYVVRWDTAELTRLYNAQQSFILEKSVSLAVEEVLKFASPIIGAAALPLTVLERAAELDCPWLVVMDRAEQAGRLLAALLLENAAAPHLSSDQEHQQYRQRAVSLIGYGFGARVIVHCLLLLATAPNHAGLGIVQDVVLIGAPVSSSPADWRQMRRVVSGRLVNCFKRDDWMLGLMYRSKAWEVGVAGLSPVHLHEDEYDSNANDEDEEGGVKGSTGQSKREQKAGRKQQQQQQQQQQM